MGGLFKEVGLKYAEFLPLMLGSAVVSVVIVVYLWIEVRKFEEPWKSVFSIALIGASLVVIVHFPVSYSNAKDYCREQWARYGGTSSTYEPPEGYLLSKCGNAWPHGPDGMPGMWP
jgi:ABC-type transport system involved in cytochrome bd biosynthesis fused ATPase/permease subunit